MYRLGFLPLFFFMLSTDYLYLYSITIVSICSLVSLVRSSTSINSTYAQWSQYMWSTIEIYTSIVCTCMPAMRYLLTRTGEYLWQTAKTRRTDYLSQKPSLIERSRISGKTEYELRGSRLDNSKELDDDAAPSKGIIMSRSFFVDNDDSPPRRTPDLEENQGHYHSTRIML